MKLYKLIEVEKPLIHLIYCNWFDLEECINFKEHTYVAIIDGKNCTSTENVFIEFANVFKFPNYFGSNWSAFDECINDLEWLSSDSYILLIKNVNHVLQGETKDFRILLNILKDTAVEWSNGRYYDDYPTEPTPFHIILHSEKEKKDLLNQRIEEVLSRSEYNEIEI
ncbi:MAG: barstar family protein [Clostridiales bacterium]|nr:barstar family protein [Clostridiales bacterium]